MSKLVGPVIAAFFTMIMGFLVLAALVFFGNGGGAAGHAAVADLSAQAASFVDAAIRGVVNLTQTVFNAASDAFQN